MDERKERLEAAAETVRQANEELAKATQALQAGEGGRGEDQFMGLPLGVLLSQPILEAARSQAALCQVYLETLFQLAYVEGDPEKGTRCIDFTFQRQVIDKETGAESTRAFTVSAPLLSLVTLPSFTMDEATVDFDMEVHDQTLTSRAPDPSSATKEGLGYWGYNGAITGKVSAGKDHTRATDNTAKYTLHARAVQQPPSEGMAKLTSLFAASIEPVENSK